MDLAMIQFNSPGEHKFENNDLKGRELN